MSGDGRAAVVVPLTEQDNQCFGTRCDKLFASPLGVKNSTSRILTSRNVPLVLSLLESFFNSLRQLSGLDSYSLGWGD